MMTRAGRRLTSFFVDVMTLVVVAVAVHDHTHRRYLHGPQHQRDHPSRTLSHDDASWQTGYRCDEVCELRQSVQKLSAVQTDHARSLHAVYGLVDTMRRELVAARYTHQLITLYCLRPYYSSNEKLC